MHRLSSGIQDQPPLASNSTKPEGAVYSTYAPRRGSGLAILANPIAEHDPQGGCDSGCERTLQLKARGTETTVRDSIGCRSQVKSTGPWPTSCGRSGPTPIVCASRTRSCRGCSARPPTLRGPFQVDSRLEILTLRQEGRAHCCPQGHLTRLEPSTPFGSGHPELPP